MNLFKLPQMVSKTSQIINENINEGFPGDPVVKNPPANAGDTVWFLVPEDHTHHGATKCVPCNDQASALDPWAATTEVTA